MYMGSPTSGVLGATGGPATPEPLLQQDDLQRLRPHRQLRLVLRQGLQRAEVLQPRHGGRTGRLR